MEFHEIKICKMEFLRKSLCMWFLWKSVSLIKIPWVSFRLEKNQSKPIELIWSQSKWIPSKEIFGILFLRSRIDENCLHQWWKENQNHFLQGIARWNDFIQVQCVEIGFPESESREVDMIVEKPWKLTSSIEKPHEPISSISNPSKFLSTIENNENRYHPLEIPLLNFLWRNVHGNVLLICSP